MEEIKLYIYLAIILISTIIIVIATIKDHKLQKRVEALDKACKRMQARDKLEEYIWAQIIEYDKQKEKENADKRKWQD